MHARFIDTKEVTVEIRSAIQELLSESFGSTSELQSFACEKLRENYYYSINWNQSMLFLCEDLVRECQRDGVVGVLLEQLLKLNPNNMILVRVIELLVRKGYLAEAASQE